MARKQNKPALKWRKVGGDWRALPFCVELDFHGDNYDALVLHPVTGRFITLSGGHHSELDAKSACQRLANAILRAMKPVETQEERIAAHATRCLKDPELKAIARDVVLRHLESRRAMKPAKKGRGK